MGGVEMYGTDCRWSRDLWEMCVCVFVCNGEMGDMYVMGEN